jgi:ComF family protein
MPSQLDRYLERLGAWALPPRCVLCTGRVDRDLLDLCGDCAAVLPVATMRCDRCAGGFSSQSTVLAHAHAITCERCRREPPPYRRCHAAYRYAVPIDFLIQSLKYRKQLALSRVLGELLARSVVQAGVRAELLVPVPLHPTRLAERGFNQAWEICRWAGRRLDIRCEPRAARRRTAGPAQARSTALERRTNLRDAFVADSSRVAARHVAIVDDVLTTGSTAAALATTLLAAGAARVDVWCLAVADRVE